MTARELAPIGVVVAMASELQHLLNHTTPVRQERVGPWLHGQRLPPESIALHNGITGIKNVKRNPAPLAHRPRSAFEVRVCRLLDPGQPLPQRSHDVAIVAGVLAVAERDRHAADFDEVDRPFH